MPKVTELEKRDRICPKASSLSRIRPKASSLSKMNRQPTEREETLANKAINKGFASVIYRLLTQLNVKEPTTQAKVGGRFK